MRLMKAAMAAVIIMSAGAATAQTTADPHAGQNAAVKKPDVSANGGPASKGANSFTKKQAADRMAKAGYTPSGELTKDKDGLWHASATKDGKTMDVSLDFKGNVNAQ